MTRDLIAARDAGVAYLLGRQHDDGHWEDYRLPVGASDAWVTAFVSLRLSSTVRPSTHRLSSTPRTSDAGDVDGATVRAAAWLHRTRPYPAGWGFNATTGPDADTTAHALMVLRCRQDVRRTDVDWLLTCWRAAGGFATFDAADLWGTAHACVTPLAFLALPEAERAARRAAVRRYVTAVRRRDGTWPSFWWRTRCYSTYWNLRLCRALGVDTPGVLGQVGGDEGFDARSVFDLSFLTAIAALEGHGARAALAGLIAAQQRPDGSWEGGEDLRVTRHDADPSGVLEGRCYRDVDGLITTASAVFALGRVIEGPANE